MALGVWPHGDLGQAAFPPAPVSSLRSGASCRRSPVRLSYLSGETQCEAALGVQTNGFFSLGVTRDDSGRLAASFPPGHVTHAGTPLVQGQLAGQ